MSDEAMTRGVKREGAGRPKLEAKRRRQGLKLSEDEGALAHAAALARCVPACAHLTSLV
jgi:hypothetical protein